MNDSYWIKHTKKEKHYPSVDHDLHVNMMIVGAGLTGLSCAYYISKTAKDAIVIESDQIGYGASGRNTGKLTFQHGLLYHTLIEKYDKVFAQRYYRAQCDAMTSIKAIIEDHHIDCDYQNSDAILYTNDVTRVADLQDEYQSYLDLGIPCEFLKSTRTPVEMEAGLQVHHQAKFNPYAYCLGLSDVLDERDIPIYEHSALCDIKQSEHGYECSVNGHIITANKVVFTCQFPFIDHMHLYFTRMRPMQESLCYAHLQQEELPSMMINIEVPMHSANIFANDIVMAGYPHKSGQGSLQEHQDFEKSLPTIYPIHDIEESWSNEDYFTFDYLPLIGKLDKHNDDLYFASGYRGWGNTTSNMAAKILSAYLLDQYSNYAMMASPQRASFLSLPFLKENLNTAYHYLKGHFNKADIDYPLKKQAKKIEIDGKLYGVYRDEDDELFILDITCPHMGCICEFNHVDKTWDCPCHGSRFSYTGEVIKGPAGLCLHGYGDEPNKVDPHIIKK